SGPPARRSPLVPRISHLSLHDALPIFERRSRDRPSRRAVVGFPIGRRPAYRGVDRRCGASSAEARHLGERELGSRGRGEHSPLALNAYDRLAGQAYGQSMDGDAGRRASARDRRCGRHAPELLGPAGERARGRGRCDRVTLTKPAKVKSKREKYSRRDAEVRGEKNFFFSDLCVSARESSWSYLGELSALDDVRRNHSARATDDTRKRLAATMARLVAGHLFRTIVTT